MQDERTSLLKELARPRGTLADLARAAGCSYSLISKVAAGQRKPNASIRRAVEDVFGIPARRVFGDEVARPRRGSEPRV